MKTFPSLDETRAERGGERMALRQYKTKKRLDDPSQERDDFRS